VKKSNDVVLKIPRIARATRKSPNRRRWLRRKGAQFRYEMRGVLHDSLLPIREWKKRARIGIPRKHKSQITPISATNIGKV